MRYLESTRARQTMPPTLSRLPHVSPWFTDLWNTNKIVRPSLADPQGWDLVEGEADKEGHAAAALDFVK
ncbi:hypothetical protein SAMD00023353_3100700 [Rosellinia necatrix]|uniref:Uncharacterized protein n=1 Tax=Rosellinia necatrix TaxID=77044 RepID=A0A1S8A8X2_ROSNE|nr:hypothetical protein SAMD00023353_3100700 [Rosellinia necatrix]